jgi:prephenate dehydrogenase
MKVTVIGGSGALGKWFGRYFHERGHKVTLHARNRERLAAASQELGVVGQPDLALSVAVADMVVVSVPIRDTPSVLKSVAPLLLEQTIVWEVASVKSGIVPVLERITTSHRLQCVAVHPMFGGGAPSIAGKVVAMIPVYGGSQALQILRDMFVADGATVFETTTDEHDRMMARVLGLPHMTNILYGLCQAGLQSPDTPAGDYWRDLAKFGGTTWRLQGTLAGAVLSESPEVYAQIQLENPYFREEIQRIRGFVLEYLDAVARGDAAAATRLISRASEWARGDPTFPGAHARFNRMVEALSGGDRTA